MLSKMIIQRDTGNFARKTTSNLLLLNANAPSPRLRGEKPSHTMSIQKHYVLKQTFQFHRRIGQSRGIRRGAARNHHLREADVLGNFADRPDTGR